MRRAPAAVLLAAALIVPVGCSQSTTDENGDDPAAPRLPPTAILAPLADDGRGLACPTSVELERLLAQARVPGEEHRIEVAGCAAGRFPEPAWFVIWWIDPRGDVEDLTGALGLRREIVRPSGELLAQADAVDIDARDAGQMSFEEIALVDLDGDGADEITYRERLEVRELEAVTYRVLRRDTLALREIYQVPLELHVAPWQADEEEDLGEQLDVGVRCAAEIAIGDADDTGARTLTVRGTVTAGDRASPEDSARCVRGTRTMRLRAGAFVDAR
jgi:hypothetical protein